MSTIRAVALAVIITAAILGVQAYDLFRLEAIARQGQQAHAVACANKANLERQINDSEKFLLLTPAQVTAKYGPAFAQIPRATIVQSLQKEQAAAAAFDTLNC